MNTALITMKSLLPPPLKPVLRKGLTHLAGGVRVMPDFIIIGAQRAGTSSLYWYLMEHPCVIPAARKEVRFFDVNFQRGVNWYRTFFPSRLYKHYVMHMRRQDFLTGEASPYYLFHPHAPRRILETIPHVKLIVSLRNPVDRAYSHYHLEVRRGAETLSFEDALKLETQRLAGEREKMLEDDTYTSFNHFHYSYLSKGIYVDQLKVWLDLFPKEQVLVLKSEEFFTDSSSITRVLEFLQLPDWRLPGKRSFNYLKPGSVAHPPERNPSMNATTRKRLSEYFAPHNQRLYDYLGVNFGWDH